MVIYKEYLNDSLERIPAVNHMSCYNTQKFWSKTLTACPYFAMRNSPPLANEIDCKCFYWRS